MAEVRPDEAGTRRRFGAYVVGLLAVLWFVVGIAMVAIIGLEAVTSDDRHCPVRGLESVYGESSWQTWPPGQVCTFGDARLEEPGAARGVAIVVEVALGVALLVVWRRYRHAPDPDWAA